MSKEGIKCLFFIAIPFLLLCFTVTAHGASIYLKSSIDDEIAVAPVYLEYVSLKEVENKIEENKPTQIIMPYSGKVIRLLNDSITKLAFAARDINGKRTVIFRPVYTGELRSGEESGEQIFLVNSVVMASIKSVVSGIDTPTLVELYRAAWDLKIHSLVNAYASQLSDRLVSGARKELRIRVPNPAQREDLVNRGCQEEWYRELSKEKQSYINKYLCMYKLDCVEHTVYDLIEKYGRLGHSPYDPQYHLDLSGKGLTSLQGLDLIRDAHQLERVHLSNNPILGQDADPEFVKEPFKSFTKLAYLDLHGNNWNSLPAVFFHGLSSLKHLELYGNQLKEVPDKLLEGLNNLEELHLSYNHLTKIPERFFATTKNIKVIALDNNQMACLNAGVFDGLNNLEELHLSHNHLTNIAEALFATTKNLKRVELNNNQVVRLSGRVFDGLTKLEWLDLSNNKLQEIEVTTFDDLACLTYLDLSNNNLSGLTKEVLCPLTKLTHLYLNHCELNCLPEGLFERSTKLERLELKQNNLMKLPSHIFYGLRSLIQLSLSENELQELPEGLLNGLIKLYYLELHNNKICYVPKGFFAGLENFKLLDIRNNAFTQSEKEFRELCGVPVITWIHFDQNKTC